MGLTLQDYTKAKKLTPALVSASGISEHRSNAGPYLRIPYTDEDGALLATRYRLDLNGPQRFSWQTGSQPSLYGLQRLGAARAQGAVVISSSESDCHTLWAHDFAALALVRPVHWREARDAASLRDVQKIYVISPRTLETEGAVAQWIQTSDIRHRVHLVRLPDGIKDVSDLYLSNTEGFKIAFLWLLQQATPWEVVDNHRIARVERELFGLCEGLAREEWILGAFLKSVKASGLAGEERNAAMIFLALTSRLLRAPVSLAFKGPSASGKNFTVKQVLAHFPDNAAIKITSMSEKALLFLNEDLRHKHIVITESDGVSSQFQDYLIRSLLSEGTLDYVRAEQGADGAMTKRYVRQGPTGLIVTTTKTTLHPDNETRLMTLEPGESADCTRDVMRATAVRKDQAPNIDPVWPALQAWLAIGERRVCVPYAKALAGLIPSGAVRTRRDFEHLLSLIEAHALLHRARRERDGHGRIVATLRDYNIVRSLVEPIFARAVGAWVSHDMRQTVRAVRMRADLVGKGLRDIAKALGVDYSTASRRCRAALEAGFVVKYKRPRSNEIEYWPGENLPEAGAQVLPAVDAVEQAWWDEVVATDVQAPGLQAQSTTLKREPD